MPHTCLVVDDSRTVRKLARRILEAADYQVSEAEDGAKALDSCRAAMPDGVLLDWNEALEAGAQEYIMKPFDADILLGKFAEAGLA
jgi:two-component system chemotaxis response regulator CheY